MSTPAAAAWRGILLRGLGAGVLGSILIDAFLYMVFLRPAHQPMTAMWQIVSATATGGTLISPWFGLLIHFCVSIAWGVGYAYAAATSSAIARHPYISGPVFGLIVMVIMQVAELAAGVKLPLTVAAFAGALIAHTLFFGLPVAVYITRAMRV